MILNLIYDAFALAAPQSFRDGMRPLQTSLQQRYTIISPSILTLVMASTTANRFLIRTPQKVAIQASV